MSRKQIRQDSPEPIRSQLREILINEISGGKFSPGGRIPSERELAEKFGISRTSVRETITELIHSGFLFRTVGKGTFVSQRTDKEPERKQSPIAFVIDEDIFNFVQTGYNKILFGAQCVCRARGTQLLFHSTRGDSILHNEISAVDGKRPIAGAIVVGGVRRHVLDRLQEEAIPLVLVDTILDEESHNFPSVTIDYGKGAKMAVQHLYAFRHQKIGYIGFSGSQKYEGYWSALEELGLSYDPRQVEFLQLLDLQPGILAGFKAMQRVLSRKCSPSAMIVTNDFVAIGALEALGLANIKVPDQISVVGFDDLGVKSSSALTTIRVDLTDVGEQAAGLLFRRMEGRQEDPKDMVIPVELIVRSSSGPYLEKTSDQFFPAANAK
jgi:GntR family transcriptional regulator, arabinose operon transcriptional repressor